MVGARPSRRERTNVPTMLRSTHESAPRRHPFGAWSVAHVRRSSGRALGEVTVAHAGGGSTGSEFRR